MEIYKLSGILTRAEQKRILGALQSKLEVKPPRGSNKVIIYDDLLKRVEELGMKSVQACILISAK